MLEQLFGLPSCFLIGPAKLSQSNSLISILDFGPTNASMKSHNLLDIGPGQECHIRASIVVSGSKLAYTVYINTVI